MKRDDLLATIGISAIGVVTGALARAVTLSARVVAVTLGTLESALRNEDEPFTLREEGPAARSALSPVSGGAFQPFEPADGITAPRAARAYRDATLIGRRGGPRHTLPAAGEARHRPVAAPVGAPGDVHAWASRHSRSACRRPCSTSRPAPRP